MYNNIKIDGYLFGRMKKVIPEESFNALGYSNNKKPDPVWTLAWGKPKYNPKHAVCESGFWWDAVHLDTEGIYDKSSLNTNWEEIESFEAPKTAKEVLNSSSIPSTKYKQRNTEVDWRGVVLALQRPKDRSVRAVGEIREYYDFVEDACKYYGKALFLKEHPSGSGEAKRWREIADKYGCTIGKVNHTVIENCEFVILYNSTFAVDCMLRRVPVNQFAPGYFYKTPAVNFTYGKCINTSYETLDAGEKLVDFLIWKYCINKKMPVEMWAKLIVTFAESKRTFPLPEEFCYANNMHWSEKGKK